MNNNTLLSKSFKAASILDKTVYTTLSMRQNETTFLVTNNLNHTFNLILVRIPFVFHWSLTAKSTMRSCYAVELPNEPRSEKSGLRGSDQARHKLSCTTTQDG